MSPEPPAAYPDTSPRMSARIFISHSGSDGDLAAQLRRFLQASLPEAQLGTSADAAAPGESGPLALKSQLASADVVVGLLSAAPAGEVPFQLGAAWAFGKPVHVLMLGEGDEPSWLPAGRSQRLRFSAETLVALATDLGAQGVAPEARAALLQLFPEAQLETSSPHDRPTTPLTEPPRADGGTTQPLWPV